MNGYEEKMQKLLQQQEKSKRYFINALICAVMLIPVGSLYVILDIILDFSIAGKALIVLAGISAAASIVFLLLGVKNKSDKKIKRLSSEVVKPLLEETFDLHDYKPLGYLTVPDLNVLFPGGVKRGVLSSGADLIKASYKGKEFAYSFLQLTEMDEDGVSSILLKCHVMKVGLDHHFPVKVIIQTNDAKKQWNGKCQESWDRYLGSSYHVYIEKKNTDLIQPDPLLAEKVKQIRDYMKCPFTLIIPENNSESVLILEPGSYWFGGHGEVTIQATTEKARRSVGYISGLLDILIGEEND